MGRVGQKHLIKCSCVLPQFRNSKTPVFHHFVVFSVIDDDRVIAKLAQCHNCGAVHNVFDISRSEILRDKEQAKSIVSIDDLKLSMSDKVVSLLEKNDADLSSWEAVKFAIEEEKWGSFVVLNSDVEGDSRMGKAIVVLGENLFKIESFVQKEMV